VYLLATKKVITFVVQRAKKTDAIRNFPLFSGQYCGILLLVNNGLSEECAIMFCYAHFSGLFPHEVRDVQKDCFKQKLLSFSGGLLL
jgi:hypothetical protein